MDSCCKERKGPVSLQITGVNESLQTINEDQTVLVVQMFVFSDVTSEKSFLKKQYLPERPLLFQIKEEESGLCVTGYVKNQKMISLKECDQYDHSQLWSLYKGELRPRSYGQIGDCLDEHGFFRKCQEVQERVSWKLNSNPQARLLLCVLSVTRKTWETKAQVVQMTKLLRICSRTILYLKSAMPIPKYHIQVRSDMINTYQARIAVNQSYNQFQIKKLIK